MQNGTSPQAGMTRQESESMRAGIAALGQHVENMRGAGKTAERIREEIAGGYIANSSSVFQRQVEDWVAQYNRVMNSFQDLQTATGGAVNVMGDAEQQAASMAAGWGGGDGVYNALTGR